MPLTRRPHCQQEHVDSSCSTLLSTIRNVPAKASITTASSAPPEGSPTNNLTQYSSSVALLNRVQRLEDTLQQERAMRETAIADERRTREREVRILREALHPFYQSEQEMKRRLIEVEDRIDATFDEQLRLKDRIAALDDANMALEKRLDETGATRSKKRRTRRQVLTGGSHDTGSDSYSHASAFSSPMGQTLSPPTSSGAMSPTGTTLHTAEHDEPRSSGILNLVNLIEPPPAAPTPREPTPREEVRSSGFLEINLAERLASKFATSPPPRDFATSSAPIHAHAPLQYQSIFNQNAASNGLPMTNSPQLNGATKATSSTSASVSPTEIGKKRTWEGELRPLHVLANLSAASPMV